MDIATMLEQSGVLNDAVSVNVGRDTFLEGSGPMDGKWATDRFKAAMAAGKEFDVSDLRVCEGDPELKTAATLRRDEWKHFDDIVVKEGLSRLQGVADLYAAGLSISIPGAMGKTIHTYEKITDLTDAQVSLDGLARDDGDRVHFTPASIPLPFIHKGFDLNLRQLEASRNKGETLDTTLAGLCSRKVSEKLESILFNGGPKFGGLNTYGYTTHPDRILQSATAAWSSATGSQILTDLQAMFTKFEADFFFGPYWLYVPGNVNNHLDDDYRTTVGDNRTIRTRMLEHNKLSKITVVDTLADDNVVMVQPTSDVVQMLDGIPTQMIQWDTYGGFRENFKIFTIQVPLIKTTAAARCGVLHQT